MTFQGGGFEGGRVQRGGGGRRGVAVGGGLVGLIVVVIAVLLGGGNLGDVLGQPSGGGAASDPVQPEQVGEIGDCTVEQANTQQDCRLAATLYALDEYWKPIVEQQGVAFAIPGATWFTQSVDTGCGTATSAVGPFYCPPDQRIYIDLDFYTTMTSQLGAQDGPLAEMYITAHEYGHHIQNLLGIMDAHDRGGTGADSGSVRTELQADCFAGMAVGEMANVPRPGQSVTFIQPITQEQLANALQAAQAVGDDRIQKNSTGSINPDTWTHGSAAQRQAWFTTGYEKGDLASCDTFGAADLG